MSEDKIHGVTLEQEERIQARKIELDHISAQAELGTQEGRAKRTRESSPNGGSASGRNVAPSGRIRVNASPGWSWRR